MTIECTRHVDILVAYITSGGTPFEGPTNYAGDVIVTIELEHGLLMSISGVKLAMSVFVPEITAFLACSFMNWDIPAD